MKNQPEDRRSVRVFGYLGVPEEERVSEERMNKLSAKVQSVLLSMPD
jgi:hypothetical protein